MWRPLPLSRHSAQSNGYLSSCKYQSAHLLIRLCAWNKRTKVPYLTFEIMTIPESGTKYVIEGAQHQLDSAKLNEQMLGDNAD